MSKTKMKKTAGFTLLEILLVVGIISILAGIVILAINPTKQLGDTRNAQRRSDVMTILNAIYQYSIDNAGVLTALEIDEETTSNLDTTPCGNTYTDASDLTALTSNSKYLVEIPFDPVNEDEDEDTSEYYVVINSDTDRITVCAPNSKGEGSIDDNGVQISVTR
jgi:prepilin-type N-terminal cleavage/methylation domain-containing protein